MLIESAIQSNVMNTQSNIRHSSHNSADEADYRTYWKLITGIKPSKLKLTKCVKRYVQVLKHKAEWLLLRHDENLSSTFLESFPEFSDDEHLRLIKDEDLKTVDMKNRWREYMKQWEKVIGELSCSLGQC